MIWVSDDFLNELRTLLGAGDDLTADNLMERLGELKARADGVTSASRFLSGDALAAEKSQLEADVAGLKSLILLKEGLLNQGLPAKKAAKKAAADSDVCKVMILAAGGKIKD